MFDLARARSGGTDRARRPRRCRPGARGAVRRARDRERCRPRRRRRCSRPITRASRRAGGLRHVGRGAARRAGAGGRGRADRRGAVGLSLPATALGDRRAGARRAAAGAPELHGARCSCTRGRWGRGGATLPPWWPALTDYVAQMHAAWLAFARGGRAHPRLRCCSRCWRAGRRCSSSASPRAAAGRRRARPLTFYDTSSYGPHALRAMIGASAPGGSCYGSDRPVVDPPAPPALGRALLQLNPSAAPRRNDRRMTERDSDRAPRRPRPDGRGAARRRVELAAQPERGPTR